MVDDGDVAVVEHVKDAGSARAAIPVLLVHSTGMCAANWDLLAAELGDSVVAYAVDLPGHGRSSAEMRTAEDGWRHLPTVVRELGLDRPLLVTHENSAFVSTVAALESPDSFRGLVSFGGAVLDSTEAAVEAIAFVNSAGFAEVMTERFRFGETGSTPAQASALVHQLNERAQADWVSVEFGDRLLPEITRSLTFAPDGSWLHRPTIETIQAMYTLAEDHPYLPGPHFYDSLRIPVWTVVLSGGFEQPSAEAVALVDDHPLMRLVRMNAGPWPQYETPEVLARLIETLALDPEADTPASVQAITR
ncbi:hypothetical protein GCM10025883_03370 [Mobilicoccus caccae]|uniref:AB hydrolase-1 domain-containing protein n=1 Tax=Mobilicoccus caccae TaxID=1859295 RepID=A0ABQ6IK36_9MICO|nr:hypothetical protein GCM10025883_03370 [Mobilicoccus caccae]